MSYPDDRLIELRGTVEGIVYSNAENGYTVCDVGTEGDELVTACGTIPGISEGDGVVLFGRWVHSPKYGRQFAVERAERILPTGVPAILRYLSSRAIRGIGPKMAKKIVDMFGEDTFDVLENHPDWLAQLPGISEKRAREIAEDFREKAGMRDAMLFFRDYFGATLSMRIFNSWGNTAVRRAKENPYRLCDEIPGVGFEKADTMAQRLGFAPDCSMRLESGIGYLLRSNASRNGHVCLPEDKLLSAAQSLLGGTPEQCRAALEAQVSSDQVRRRVRDGVPYIYDRSADEDEAYIAAKLCLLDRLCVVVGASNVNAFIEREERTCGIAYAALQRQAICDAMQSGVMILTGGPGTGKTTVVRALIDIFESMDYTVALTAPTGRAAKRMSESTAHEAKTIHRLLEVGFGDEVTGERRFRRDENNTLDENVIIVDEASMIGNGLLASLLRAIKPGARLILIGDADQLPSVEAGNILHDLIASGRFPTVCLTEIFRQAQKSLIITNAHAINAGQMPRLDVRDNDFFYLRRESARDIVYTIADLCKNRLPRTYGESTRDGIQVISPSRKGEGGTENLNVLLQSSLNPADDSKAEYRDRERIFRVGDRVMQTRNNYDLTWQRADGSTGSGVYNGDIGVILDINHAAECMEIHFDEREVVYDFSLLDELEHAYAITVHKSQGSEYPIVILPLYDAPALLLTRHLFYTAVTRAQKMVILVGREEVARTMVENERQSLRYTGLARRLCEATADGGRC